MARPEDMAYISTSFKGDVIIGSEPTLNGFHTRECEGTRYDGYFAGGKANGYGFQTIPWPGMGHNMVADYSGDWRNGLRNGFGRLWIPLNHEKYRPNHSIYEGGWKDGRAFGFGKLEIHEKDQSQWWEFGFNEGLLHGYGVYHNINNTNNTSNALSYSGGYRKNKWHGYSSQHIGSRETQWHSMKDGALHGFTVISDNIENPLFYRDGNATRDLPQNILERLDWLPEVIEFKVDSSPIYRDLAAGRNISRTTTLCEGEADIADIYNYRGNLSYGMPHGYGVLTCVSPTGWYTFEGGWKRGFAAGYGVWWDRNGNKYKGGWRRGKPFGYGEVSMSGKKFETYWDGRKFYIGNERVEYGKLRRRETDAFHFQSM
jgi:hypothetical protein